MLPGVSYCVPLLARVVPGRATSDAALLRLSRPCPFVQAAWDVHNTNAVGGRAGLRE
eukprot:gene20193-biopygen1026